MTATPAAEPTVRALTVRQPWADAVAHGPKRVENRSRPTKYRGLLLIHAGLAADRNALSAGLLADWPDVRGAVIALAELVDCHEAKTPCCCGAWAFPGMWHWSLAAVRALPEPIPARGALGLWRPDADVLAAVEAQYPQMEVAW